MNNMDPLDMAMKNCVAVVDDYPKVLGTLGQLLSGSGYDVELFESGKHFLSNLHFSEASCILLDIQLNDCSGVELGRQLAATGFKVPIIFLTGSEDDRVRDEALTVGVDYLQKPVKAERLLEAVAKAIASGPKKG
jgi:FixJ family two-component response regulator